MLAHSNEAEWHQFKNNRNNEAFLDRISVIKVPYCLRIEEERQIYDKLLASSELGEVSCAPETLSLLAQFCLLTRLREHENSSLYSKMRVYDGQNLKDTDPKAKSVQEYRETAGVDEGMNGVSTRFAFKVLSETFNYDTEEVAADPVHMMYVLEQAIKREQFPEELEKNYLEFVKSDLSGRYAEFIGHEIQKAYLESYTEYGQNLFDRYIAYADAWIEEQDFRDPDTGQIFNREILDAELSKIEKPAGIANPKDFRNEVVKFALRARAQHGGNNPSWTSYEKLREVIEKRMFSQVEELLPIISFGSKKDGATDKQHKEFVQRMTERGYTERQVRRLVRVVHAGQQSWIELQFAGTYAPLHRSPPQSQGQEPGGTGSGFCDGPARKYGEAVNRALKDRNVSDTLSGETITIPTKGIVEPRFRLSPTGGNRDRIFPGNKEFSAGDRLPKPPKGGGEGRGKKGSDQGDGTDEFEFVLSRDEFLDLFFEDLELPDLVKTSLMEIENVMPRRAGIGTSGTPTNINVIRTMRMAMGRRLALKRPRNHDVLAIEARIFALEETFNLDETGREELARLRGELAELKRRQKAVPYIDPLDIRYNQFVQQPEPRTRAVMFCLMDVSGSMGEREKDLAKRFFRAAASVPEAPLQENRRCFHQAYAPGPGGRRGDIFPQP